MLGEEIFFVEGEAVAGKRSLVLLDPLVGVEPELIFRLGVWKLDEVIDELFMKIFEALEMIFREIKGFHFSELDFGVEFERCV